MMKIGTIGLDLAQNVFQLHSIDAAGAVALRRELGRAAVENFFARLRQDGVRAASHSLAASCITHSNPDNWWRNQVNCRLA
jgi:hypothetical protein